MSATYTTEQAAELLGVSTWTLYETVRRGDPPIPPVRVGRRLVWPKCAVNALLGLDSLNDESGPEGPLATTTLTPVVATTPKGCRHDTPG